MSRKFISSLVLLAALSSAPAANNISILGLFKDKALVSIDGRQELLVAGNPTADGVLLLSANSREAVIEINGVRASYQLNDAISSKFAAPTGRKSVSIAPDEQGMYWVNGSINGFQVRFVVDTGATMISMNRNHARRFGIDYRSTGKVTNTSTASGIEEIYVLELDRVAVGDLQFSKVAAAIHDSDYPELILLGNSFLNRVDMRREGRLLQLLDMTP